MKNEEKKVINRTFLIALTIKGIDGLLEFMGGFFSLFMGVAGLKNILEKLRIDLIGLHASSLWNGLIIRAEESLNAKSQLFFDLFLLTHGFVKLFIVCFVLKKKRWAYPAAIGIFGVFTIVQIFQLIQGYSLLLLLLTVLDIAVIGLTAWEWKNNPDLQSA